MLMRQLAGYAPAVAFPRIVAFATLIVFTHFLEPSQYGRYALVIVTTEIVDVVCFRWLRLGLIRNFVKAGQSGQLARLLSSIYLTFAAMCLAVVAVYAAAALLLPDLSPTRHSLLLGCAYLLFRSSVLQNLELHRAGERVRRYGLIQYVRGGVGFALAVLLVAGLKMDERGLLLGQAIAFALVLLIDLPIVAKDVSIGAFDRPRVGGILRYSTPLAISFFLLTIITTSDRYFLQFLEGSAAVGVYSASYVLAANSIGLVFMLVNTAAYPLAIKMFEVDGEAAARRRLKQNASVMLAIGMPATIGLVLIADTVATTILGDKFQAASGTIIGWIALAFFLSSVKAHIYDQGFHLARKTTVQIWTYVPAALLNLVLNWILIPRFGVVGAAYATVTAFVLSLVLSIVLTRNVFRIEFPVREALRVAVATVPMIAVVSLPDYPQNLPGLALMIALGATTYVVAAVGLDVIGTRRFLLKSMAAQRS